ncbi:nucleotidyl transferase AbiEii/AbiGii toxin family protein [Desulfatibacillum alkenivorans]|jgi:predicted nucleotidyltransferase component of viral defense system|uniref:nucleotidyl transferase AbiEii/AbiGii toxin family protein n=1 Tax=Desulfatibacillum alkenivorans TaxID=259354 RepID=UPI000936A01B
MPEDHARGKWILGRQGALGQPGNIEVDLNFMFCVPLWPVVSSESKNIGAWAAHDIPLLDIHEILAGKLAALFARRQARDLFDCYNLFEKEGLDRSKIRSAFIAYGAMNRKDWRTVSLDDVNLKQRAAHKGRPLRVSNYIFTGLK